jgi:hypothetical protein
LHVYWNRWGMGDDFSAESFSDAPGAVLHTVSILIIPTGVLNG